MSTCYVFSDYPDQYRAECDCGWIGTHRLFKFMARRDAKRHCELRKHELGDPLILITRP